MWTGVVSFCRAVAKIIYGAKQPGVGIFHLFLNEQLSTLSSLSFSVFLLHRGYDFYSHEWYMTLAIC